MKTFFKKILGLDKIEKEKEDLQAARDLAIAETAKAQEEERKSKLTPKERATEAKEPWVAVLDTHVNKENLRNGFFELDWNEYFVVQLRQAGYTGSTEEEIVDQWFSELCRNVAAEEGVDMSRRGSGYVNRALRDDGKTEVS